MFTSAELERFSMLLDKPMNELEQRIMSDIIRRIRQNGEITRAADWQISRLYQLGVSYDEIDAAIAQALGLSDKELEALYSGVISKGYARDKGLYDKTGVPFIPFEENEELRQLISSVAEQTGKTLKNITGSLGFAVNTPGGISFLPIAKYYQRTLDDAMLDIASGAFDYNTVLKRVISELTNSGLRTVDYATGHSNRVEVAARRALQTGIGQLTDKVNNDNAEELGTDWFEVTVSRCARPTHAVWQGRVFRSADLVRVCGLGRVDGLCGANCYHDKHPFIPGISQRAYTDEELDEIIRQENTPREWNGKQYTAYEATQRQRRLETTMRAQRQKIKLLEEGGADEDTLTEARARYRTTSAEYSRFSNACGIPQQRERVTVDGLGAIGNKPIDKSGNSGIIREGSNQKPITEITDSAIERVPNVKISGYTDEQCAEIQKQHKELLEYSRKNNENKEVAFVFDNLLSDRKEFIGKDDILDFGGYLYGKDLFVMHNHPRNSSYSVTDLIFFKENSNVKTLTIVKNNGRAEILTKNENYDSERFKLEYDRLYRKIVKNDTDEEKNIFVRALLNKNKSGVIWSERKQNDIS